ncbi:MAG: hypothetical protein [Olavius algarvensis Gamma 1 endosymbiont]|nr:MAG: hypothetical protein [Olavius algarvensis Gamma 1 endosymbiont]
MKFINIRELSTGTSLMSFSASLRESSYGRKSSLLCALCALCVSVVK